MSWWHTWDYVPGPIFFSHCPCIAHHSLRQKQKSFKLIGLLPCEIAAIYCHSQNHPENFNQKFPSQLYLLGNVSFLCAADTEVFLGVCKNKGSQGICFASVGHVKETSVPDCSLQKFAYDHGR